MRYQNPQLYLSTLVLYHERDERYYHAVLPHLKLMLLEAKVGSYRPMEIGRFNVRDQSLSDSLKFPTCLICLLTPTFLAAMQEQRLLWSELAHAHRLRKVLILPIVAESCAAYRATNLLRTVPVVRPGLAPLSELLTRSDAAARLGELFTRDCREKMESALRYFTHLGKHWKHARARHDTDTYMAFGENFGESQYGPEAERRRDKLREEELWAQAQAVDDVRAYLYYLTESPLETYREQAVERIVAIELDPDYVRADVENNPDIGLLFDYKSRYRYMLDWELVEDRIRDALGEPLRLDKKHPWPKVEAQYLKRKVYKKCTKAEVMTYGFLENYGVGVQRIIYVLLKKLRDRIDLVKLCNQILLLIFSLAILVDVGTNLVRYRSIWWVDEAFFVQHYIVSVSMAVVLYLLRNIGKNLDRDITAADEVFKAVTKELVLLRIAFIRKTEYGRCLREIHNAEEWSIKAGRKRLISYAFTPAEKMAFHAYRPRKLERA